MTIKDNIIQFPYHKVKASKKEEEILKKNYYDIINENDPEDLGDEDLCTVLINAPISTIGDVFDESWWSRRISWLLRIADIVEHPIAEDLLKGDTAISSVHYDIRPFNIVFKQDKIKLAIKVKVFNNLTKSELIVADESLRKNDSEDCRKILFSLFEQDYDKIEPEWEVISLVELSSVFYDLSEIVVGSEDFIATFEDCGTYLVILDEFINRYMQYSSNNDDKINTLEEALITQGNLKALKILRKLAKK